MNKKLLLELADKIEETGRVNMGFWICSYKQCVNRDSYIDKLVVSKNEDSELKISDIKNHECHTVGCIAGWAVSLYGKGGENEHEDYIASYAQMILDLTDSEADNLFFKAYWPIEWYNMYAEVLIMKDRAKVVSDYIRWFVEENK